MAASVTIMSAPATPAAAPYYDTTVINPWALRATKAGYEMTTMQLSPDAEFSYVAVMRIASGSGGVAR